jgi:hypothetical protein
MNNAIDICIDLCGIIPDSLCVNYIFYCYENFIPSEEVGSLLAWSLSE